MSPEDMFVAFVLMIERDAARLYDVVAAALYWAPKCQESKVNRVDMSN